MCPKNSLIIQVWISKSSSRVKNRIVVKQSCWASFKSYITTLFSALIVRNTALETWNKLDYKMVEERKKFQFAIDRGGTFTDVFAKCPNGQVKVMKLLSVDPKNYPDAPVRTVSL